ncbi:MAG: response regulator [Chloroflexia bacterium]|nr:response regulator [Chloroflexia bacterium]
MPLSTSSILVVDDEPKICFLLQEILEREGHQVVALSSGEAALEQFAAREFDLVLLDLKLKGLEGLEVLRRLRQSRPEVTVIVLTANACPETVISAFRQGAYDYLIKPCPVHEIRDRVRVALREHQERRRLQQLAPGPCERIG